jgi:hypothetical protein
MSKPQSDVYTGLLGASLLALLAACALLYLDQAPIGAAPAPVSAVGR